MHVSIQEQGEWLNSVLRGHYAYFAVPTNIQALSAFRHHITVRWIKRIRYRSQLKKDGLLLISVPVIPKYLSFIRARWRMFIVDHYYFFTDKYNK